VDWSCSGYDKRRALVNSVINLRVPLNVGKLSTGYSTGGLSSSAQLHIVNSGVDGRKTLKWFLEEKNVFWIGFLQFLIDTSSGVL
jgi:hypothetical protein